jgi:Resolvase, N terminal domain
MGTRTRKRSSSRSGRWLSAPAGTSCRSTSTTASAAQGRHKRPAFDRLATDATRRRFDVVMARSVDRLGRSLRDLVVFLGHVHAQGVDLYLDRINGVVHPRTRLAPDATVPIGWVAVGDPAEILPPDEQEAFWRACKGRLPELAGIEDYDIWRFGDAMPRATRCWPWCSPRSQDGDRRPAMGLRERR